MAAVSILSLATEDAAAARARTELARVLAIGAKDAAKGEALDEVIGMCRRVLDEQERSLVGERRRGKTWLESVEEIYRRAADPWVSIRLGQIELLNLRIGSYITLIGPEGGGKSSLALQLLAQHERDVGPAIYVTPELDHDEGVARVVGQDRGATWREVLTGRVGRDQVRDRPRWRTLEREDATIARLTDEVLALQLLFPGQPIAVAWDYLQASPGDSDGERLRIARISSGLRQTAKRLGLVIMGISQSSRDGSKKLDSGELIGTDASRTGAESSQIERDSYAIIAIGDRRPREDGKESRSISIGKYRMGAGDQVHEAVYDGRTGYWSLEGEVRAAADVRAERKGKNDDAKVNAAELAIITAAQRGEQPFTRDQLEKVAATMAKLARLAIANLMARGELVEVARRAPRSKVYLLWTPARASAHGIPIVGEEVSDDP